MRPKPIAVTTWLLAASTLVGYGHLLLIDLHTLRPLNLTVRLIITVTYALAFLILWFYWRGRNWARIVIMLVSAYALFNLRHLGSVDEFTTVKLVAQGALGAFLLYWLNTASGRVYFAPRPPPESNPGPSPLPEA